MTSQASAPVFEFDQVLDPDGLATVRRAIEGHPGYPMLVSEPVREGFGAGYLSRHDVFSNFLRTGGVAGRPVELDQLVERINFFRATLAYGERVEVAGVEPYLFSARLREAAVSLFERPVVEPAIVFVNILVPGQELGAHADVPEFWGFDRDQVPEWLLAVMHHSGLFEAERVAIATAVTWFGGVEGGHFHYWPEGPDAPGRALEIADNRGVLLDTDSVFHAVAPVAWTRTTPRPRIELGTEIGWDDQDRCWVVRHGARELVRLSAQEVRISLSWKARCFASEADRARILGAHARGEGLELDEVLRRLRADLHGRGRLPSPEPGDERELIAALLDTYMDFPRAAA